MLTLTPQTAIKNLGIAASLSALALYAVASSPTPAHMGAIEMMILVLLLIACLCGAKCKGARTSFSAKLWGVMCLYGLLIPTLIGALSANIPTDILRDMLAFSTLVLPVFLAPLFQGRFNLFIYALVLSGLTMAGRYLASPQMIWEAISAGVGDASLLYLANSPLVMFSAIWLLAKGAFYERRLWLAPLYIVVAILPVAAMLAMSQRSTLALLVLFMFALLCLRALKTPKRASIVLAFTLLILSVSWGVVSAALQSLVNKTLSVGSNARADEWRAVLDTMASSPITTIFGTGWGSMLASPAVGGVWVRFVHGFLLSALWKTGFFGLLLSFSAFISLFVTGLRAGKQKLWICSGLVVAALSPWLLYGSYKSFCFGLILTGIAIAAGWTSPKQSATHNPT